MHYEWDAAKAESNLRKHNVDFADAVGMFDDPLALSMPDPDVREERFLAIGIDLLGRTHPHHLGAACEPRRAQGLRAR